ncbi:MAG TPA: dihydrolipoamide acetyltransferase family protein [Candidatus Acidoferrales bacterium]|jgi:pyruvate dehydrogenase E2 component (dihydrolipoamide acetyltransferase)|nr:dihydrolipoamide acetyltransferase family protein [Candidatus Acidoferrales bacterium]
MAHSIVMPALEMAQETGKLISWRKKEGEAIGKGEPLLDIETDKAVVEIESPADGILVGVKAHAGDVIPVGQTIAWVVSPGEEIPAEIAAASGRRMETAVTASPAPPTQVSAQTTSAPAANARISPKARRLAKEHGVDLSRVRGTGGEGEIQAEDILAFVAAGGAATANTKSAQAEAYATQPLSQVARLMAERTTQSWTSAPHFFVIREIDASALIAAREKFAPGIEKDRGVKLSHTDLLIAAVAHALAKHPTVNASWSGNGVQLNSEINVGVAMAVEDGVVVAAIPSTDKKKLGEIAVMRRDLTERARGGKLRPADITGATFTISNLGMYQVHAFTAIIVSPQAAILAVGRIADRVVPVDGKPAIRPMLTLTLSCDHRVLDGARGALFLNDLASAILEPEKLIQ